MSLMQTLTINNPNTNSITLIQIIFLTSIHSCSHQSCLLWEIVLPLSPICIFDGIIIKLFYFIDIVASRMPKVKPDRSEVTTFDKDNLKKVDTTEKSVLPDQKGMVCLTS
jgi:hypothetical protein